VYINSQRLCGKIFPQANTHLWKDLWGTDCAKVSPVISQKYSDELKRPIQPNLIEIQL